MHTVHDVLRRLPIARRVRPIGSILPPRSPRLAFVIFNELLTEIARVRYYPPKAPRPPQPGVSRRPISKWQFNKTKDLANNNFPEVYPRTAASC